MTTLVFVHLDDALASCLASWDDLFDYANRLAVRRGGSPVFAWQSWKPGEPEPPAPDVVLVPARRADALDPGRPLSGPPSLAGTLARWAAAGTVVAAVCAGVFCVAEARLLDGRRATTHWSLAEAFRRRFPRVILDEEALVIDEPDRVIGGGMTAYFDVGLRLVRRYAGAEVARDAAALFVLDPERRHQSPFAPVGFGGEDDPLLARAVDWAQTQPRLDFGVAAWASALAVEKRTLERHALASWGHGPAERLRRLSLDRARLLLSGGSLRWDEVADRCGYRDAAAFRRLFLGRMGQTPGEYRRRFGAA